MRPADSGRYPSGQRGQTVNLLAYAFGGSNPPLPTILTGASRPEQIEGGLRKARPREARAVLPLRETCVVLPLIGATTRGTRVSARQAGTTTRVSPVREAWPREARAVPPLGVPPSRKVRGASYGAAPHLNKAHVVQPTGGNSSAVERQPSKLGVAGSNPVSRSRSRVCAHVAQSAERVLGKDEVSGSIPDMGSRT